MRKRAFAPHVRWTDAEIGILREFYPEGSNELLLSKLPGRTLRNIGSKAWGIGVLRVVKPRMTKEEVKESKRAAMADRRAADPERSRAYQMSHYHRNREMALATMKRYQRRRFFWRRAVKFKDVTGKQLASLWKKQRGKCALTGRRMDRSAQLDHIVAIARGGGDEITNLRWLCKEANLALRDLSDMEFIQLCRDTIAWSEQQMHLKA